MRLAILAISFPLLSLASEIPRGSHVLLRLTNSISTRTARPGDYVYMRTASPIAAGGEIVVPEGSYAQGVVYLSTRSGRVKGRAELGIRLETLTLASGKVVRISPQLASVDGGDSDQKIAPNKEGQIEQGGTKGADAERVATIAGGGAALGGLTDRSWKGAGIGAGVGSAVGLATVLLTRGREVELKQGSTVDVVFERAVSME